MKNNKKFLLIGCIILGCVNITWWIFNSVQYLDFPQLMDKPEIYHKLVLLGWLFLLASHILILLTTVLTFKIANRNFIAGVLLLITGMISFFLLLLHVVSLLEIGNEYPQGYPINGLVHMIWTSQFLHLAFLLFMMIYFRILLKQAVTGNPKLAVFREQLFVALHITGIVAGIIGLLWTLLFFTFDTRHSLRNYDIVPFAFILMPYFIVLTGWFLSLLTQKKSSWFDEKQRTDIYSAGMFALLIPVPVIIIQVFVELMNITSLPVYIDGTITILWMPFYLFLTVFSFSSAALYKYRWN